MTTSTAPLQPSYARVLRHPGMARIVASMLLSRTGDSMWSILVVLFALAHFHSPLLAGGAAALGQIPNKFMAPLVGTLLDRHGRTRLVLLDYIVAGTTLAAIAVLSATGNLNAPLFLLLCAVAGMTSILSATGLRSLFPLLLPRDLWDRGNALDSATYVVSGLLGPAAAGILVGIGGGEAAVGFTSAIFLAGAVVCVGVPDPPSVAPTNESLWRAAWIGIVYVVHNRSLRGLAIVLSAINFGMGVLFVALPVLVISHLGGSPPMVGMLFVIFSIAGLVSGVLFGRAGSEGRERRLLLGGTLGMAAGVALLTMAGNVVIVAVALAVIGMCNGPIDIGLFALRQRRTAPAMLGRALAVTMALNGSGMPAGSLTAGALVPVSLQLTFLLAAGVTLIGAGAVYAGIPRDADAIEPINESAEKSPDAC